MNKDSRMRSLYLCGKWVRILEAEVIVLCFLTLCGFLFEGNLNLFV